MILSRIWFVYKIVKPVEEDTKIYVQNYFIHVPSCHLCSRESSAKIAFLNFLNSNRNASTLIEKKKLFLAAISIRK